MAHSGATLVKLSCSSLVLQDPGQDLRGLDVYDQNGQKIGTVEDLYVDEVAQNVHFLEVGAGGFLGIGRKYVLIPCEAITDASENRVSIDRTRKRVMGAPGLNADRAPQADYPRDLYGYHGYPPPLGPPFGLPVHPGMDSESSRRTRCRHRAE